MWKMQKRKWRFLFTVNSDWAASGTECYDKKHNNLRGLVGGIASPHRVAIMATEASGITDLQQIRDKKMPLKLVTTQLGSQGEIINQQVFAAYGMTYDDIKAWGGSVEHLDQSVAIKELQDGRADLLIQNIGVLQPNIVELTNQAKINFLSLSDEAIASLKKLGHIPVTIPAGEFKGQDKDAVTIGYHTGIIARSDMPDDVAYLITKTICENQEALAKGHSSFKDFDPTTAFSPDKIGGIPLHPGAERYYKEKGLIK